MWTEVEGLSALLQKIILKEVPLSQHYTKACIFYWSRLGFILFLSHSRNKRVVSCPVWHISLQWNCKLWIYWLQLLFNEYIFSKYYITCHVESKCKISLGAAVIFHRCGWDSATQLCYLHNSWKAMETKPNFKVPIRQICFIDWHLLL